MTFFRLRLLKCSQHMKTLIVDGCYTQQELRTSDIAVKETIGIANFWQEFMHWGNDYYCILFSIKTRCNSHAPEDVLPACQTTLKNLQLKYLDLYLVSGHTSIIIQGQCITEGA